MIAYAVYVLVVIVPPTKLYTNIECLRYEERVGFGERSSQKSATSIAVSRHSVDLFSFMHTNVFLTAQN
ncbi:unnamed protein product [Ceratitis capitata]|uniref:(Mediterranean fruit fly) hypothetical protein n=1 Tax=Ceratitis capitata TaxID=7213 RepID=A0A811V1D9_CERCA|nr:unnamed protein product [Ceratitis capitata]